MMVKVCGATTPQDVELLAASGADFVGLWYGIPGGHADLSIDELTRLATVARACGITPMLVTFTSDIVSLTEVVERTGIRWLQLHAYQPPQVIRGLRATIPGELAIVKVIHMRQGKCLEGSFLPSYEKAGTDIFLLDKVTDDGRIGSTGQQLLGTEVIDVVDRFSRPFLLAGGISANNRGDYESVIAHPRFYGIDVDSSARNETGRFSPAMVSELTRRWGTS